MLFYFGILTISGTPYLLDHFPLHSKTLKYLTAARLTQLEERRSAERQVVSSNPGQTIN